MTPSPDYTYRAELLRVIERQPVTMASADRRTLTALAARCLVGIPAGERMPYSRARWQLTDAGRRVLAEQDNG